MGRGTGRNVAGGAAPAFWVRSAQTFELGIAHLPVHDFPAFRIEDYAHEAQGAAVGEDAVVVEEIDIADTMGGVIILRGVFR